MLSSLTKLKETSYTFRASCQSKVTPERGEEASSAPLHGTERKLWLNSGPKPFCNPQCNNWLRAKIINDVKPLSKTKAFGKEDYHLVPNYHPTFSFLIPKEKRYYYNQYVWQKSLNQAIIRIIINTGKTDIMCVLRWWWERSNISHLEFLVKCLTPPPNSIMRKQEDNCPESGTF